jgi:UDPglucose 6-dehydrogenase
MKISIFGNGYVGLVTGACLAEIGHQVLCMDVDLAKVKGLQQGEIPIYEPGLEDLVINNVAAGNLQFTSDLPTAIDLLFIAVGPPPDEDGSADLSHVLEVSRNIGKFMDREKLVVTKSTVPVGTSDQVLSAIKNELQLREVEFSIEVASSPEFLKEGAAVADFMKPDRIVVGATS